MMTKEQYLERSAQQDDWAPGWDAIDEAFARVYPGVEPPHLAADLPARAIFGGPEYVDGISFYPSPRGYQYVLTFGMTVLYTDEEAFGGDESGWGYEMTMKVAASSPEEARWTVPLLTGLARYTFTQQRWLEPLQFVDLSGPIAPGDTALQGVLVVPDTEVDGIDTVHGRVEFLQLFGITRAELDWVRGEQDRRRERAEELVRRIRESGNVDLVTDLGRRESLV